MAEDFVMYTAKVADLGDTVGERAKAYIDRIDEITTIVNGLSAIWGGPTYDTFKATYDSNLANLEELNTVLSQMSANIGETAAQGESMINTINNLMGQ